MDALGEDVGAEAGAPEAGLDGEGVVGYGVAVGEGGQHLVDLGRAGPAHAAGVPAISSRKESVRRSTMSQSYSRAT